MQTHGFAIKLKYVGTVLVQSFLVLFFSPNTQELIRPLHPGYPPAPPRSWREEKRLEKRWFSKTLLFLSLPCGCTSEDHKTFDRLKQYVICMCGGGTRGDRYMFRRSIAKEWVVHQRSKYRLQSWYSQFVVVMAVGYRDNVRDLYELIFEFSSSCLFFLGVARVLIQKL